MKEGARKIWSVKANRLTDAGFEDGGGWGAWAKECEQREQFLLLSLQKGMQPC